MKRQHAITDDVIGTASESQDTQLPVTFDSLTTQEKIAIRSAVRAINSLDVAKFASDIDLEAFRNQALRVGGSNFLYDSLVESAKRIGWDDGAHQQEIQSRYDALFTQAATEMREVLKALVRDGCLPMRSSLFSGLAATFMSDVFAGWSVELSESGHAKILMQPRFKSALGLIAYVILRLSEISAHQPALLICDQCGKFKLIESTGGDRITRYCSGRCRNLFNVTKHRRKEAARVTKRRRPTKKKRSSRKLK